MLKKIFLFLSLLTAFSVSSQPYHRVVSLAPSFTRSLYYMDAQQRLVGRTSYCETEDEDHIPVVSSAVKANIEKIVSLHPDLVLASGLSNPKDLELLRKMNIKVEVLLTPKSFDEICEQFIRIGMLVGKGDRAKEVVDESRSIVSKIKKEGIARDKREIFFQIGADPLFAVIPDTFMDDYMTFLGAENVTAGLTQGSVSREFVLSKNPDYIFIATMGIVGEKEQKTWKKYTTLKAAKYGHIYTIDSETACQPTPPTFVQTLKVMAHLMIE